MPDLEVQFLQEVEEMIVLQQHSKQAQRALRIYRALGPGPWTVHQAEEALGQRRLGPVMGALRESKVVTHHNGSQLPMVRRRGEERFSPMWSFTPEYVRKFDIWINQERQEAMV